MSSLLGLYIVLHLGSVFVILFCLVVAVLFFMYRSL